MTRPAMIFAAGLGRRMRPLTDRRPKPLMEVGGRALVDHALDLALSAKARPIVVNVHHHAAQMRAHLQDRDVLISDETERLLETGGGLRMARPLLGPGPVFTLNSDAVWVGPSPLAALDAAWDPTAMDALLAVAPVSATRGHAAGGDFALGPDGRLTRGGSRVYLGAQILDPALLDGIEDEVFSLNRAWDRAARAGRLFGIDYTGAWVDVGTPAGLALGDELLSEATR